MFVKLSKADKDLLRNARRVLMSSDEAVEASGGMTKEEAGRVVQRLTGGVPGADQDPTEPVFRHRQSSRT